MTPQVNSNSGIVQLAREVSYHKQCGTISKLVRSLITVFIYPISQGCRYNYNFLLPLKQKPVCNSIKHHLLHTIPTPEKTTTVFRMIIKKSSFEKKDVDHTKNI